MLELYKNIKDERIKHGWTQTELAQKVGYSDKSMIAKIESGKVDLSQTKIRMFAQVFNCTESFLMGWDDDAENALSEIKNELYSNFTNDEQKILEAYRTLDEEGKRQIVLMLAFLKEQKDK